MEKTQLAPKASHTPLILNRGHGHPVMWYDGKAHSTLWSCNIPLYSVREKPKKANFKVFVKSETNQLFSLIAGKSYIWK